MAPVAGISRLWTVEVNPLSLKCRTLPLLAIRNPYSRAFHLSWLGFFVAFLSWFAFPPLIPEAIKSDLKLTTAQIGNSNIVALCSTLLVRIVVGPLVDRFGPRKVMASLLVLGAIPSGLAGTVSSAGGLYVVRFFIGILGATFVPCQAWTTVFFDTNIVGSANALVAGWGNAGGGMTFIIMVALYNRLTQSDHLSSHSAWRAAFAIVPVPALLSVAALMMIFGEDHPAGNWDRRWDVPALHERNVDGSGGDEEISKEQDEKLPREVSVSVNPAPASDLTRAVNSPLTLSLALRILVSPLTWLPSLAYFSTFGYELAIDGNLSNVLFGLFPSLGQTKAGYITAAYGLLNIFTRPLGGYMGDAVHRRLGVGGKKYSTLLFGFVQGLLSLGLGIYIDSRSHPSLAVVIVLLVITAVFNEAANGLNFALVPHCNPNSNGMMSGLVGAMGNAGGVIFAVIFRLQPLPFGKAFWISGVLAMVINFLLVAIRVPGRGRERTERELRS